jgi:hypothetical protein
MPYCFTTSASLAGIGSGVVTGSGVAVATAVAVDAVSTIVNSTATRVGSVGSGVTGRGVFVGVAVRLACRLSPQLPRRRTLA